MTGLHAQNSDSAIALKVLNAICPPQRSPTGEGGTPSTYRNPLSGDAIGYDYLHRITQTVYKS
jgi:hypothetical protein